MSTNIDNIKINKLREKGITIVISCHEKELTDALTEKQYIIQNGYFREYHEKKKREFCLLLEKENVHKIPEGMEKYGTGFRLWVSEDEADGKILNLLQEGWSLKGMYYEENMECGEI